MRINEARSQYQIGVVSQLFYSRDFFMENTRLLILRMNKYQKTNEEAQKQVSFFMHINE